MKIGIDIGKVIIGGEGEDTIFTDDYLSAPSVKGARLSLQGLTSLSAGHEVHLVSKCGPDVEHKSMMWLGWHNYIGPTLRPQRVHFVRKRHLKAPMAQALELEIFIDDRQDIIDSMQGIVAHPIMFTSWEQANKELQEIFDTAAKG